MLPDMDGFDVVRRLRGGGARIPVVFLTARDATEDKVRGLTMGGDDYAGEARSPPADGAGANVAGLVAVRNRRGLTDDC